MPSATATLLTFTMKALFVLHGGLTAVAASAAAAEPWVHNFVETLVHTLLLWELPSLTHPRLLRGRH
jgi:hypothetical protein